MELQTIIELLIELAKDDTQTRERLVKSGELFRGYNSEMEAVHLRNAAQLEKVLDEHGWLTKAQLGDDAYRAEWMIAQHAISLPVFQRKCLKLLGNLIEQGENSVRFNYALLHDRISFNERRPQRFGTQFDWDETGQMRQWTLEDPEHVNQFRTEYGLPALNPEQVVMNEPVPDVLQPFNYHARQEEIFQWSKKTGWIE